MALKLYNTRSRAVEPLQTREPGRVRMYCCGPTVHNFAHIGNFRTFVSTDLLRRFLEFKGLAVEHAMNITDVEDKIIKAVNATGRTLRDFTGEYETAFLQDFDALHCARPHHLPHATEYIPEIIDLIERLVARGIAYRAADGSVYFSIDKYRACGCRYGQLLNLNFDEMRVGERVASDEYAKESLADFALWKARVPEDGAVFWPSPWGDGRPGWHIECSAMAMKILGPSFDLHLGGEDLVFPHHEDEIAQSEGAGLQQNGEPFVQHWVHCAHLLVEGKKMAKSLGNFFTLRDLLAKGYTGREIRCLLIRANYRDQFNFTIDGLNEARANLARIDELITKLQEQAGPTTPIGPISPISPIPTNPPALTQSNPQTPIPPLPLAEEGRGEGSPSPITNNQSSPPASPAPSPITNSQFSILNSQLTATPGNITAPEQQTLQAFESALDQDLNISGAWAVIFDWITTQNRLLAEKNLTPAQAATALATWTRLDSVLGLGPKPAAETPPELLALLEERQTARKTKNFARSDAIRDELKSKGWQIEDTPKGPRLKKL